MYLSYVYKLRPNQQQIKVLDSWLNLLRAHYNWCLADRISTYYQRFTIGEYCNIRTKAVVYPIACCVAKNGATGEPWKKSGKKRNAGAIQSAGLPILKKARPWYKKVESQVLQGNLARLDTAYKNFFEGRGRFPKFKNRSNFRSIVYWGSYSINVAKSYWGISYFI